MVVDSRLAHECRSMKLFDQMHLEWQIALSDLKKNFSEIDTKLINEVIAPDYDKVMRALGVPISTIRVVIIGQDPYARPGYAHGLAFSVNSNITSLPPSLKNIFKELAAESLGANPAHGDLSRWAEQGVLLLNRILTTRIGEPLAHADFGWQIITDEVAKILGRRKVAAILWGNYAQELTQFFSKDLIISSPHPSPLSAYRGFFGSQPFSRVNKILVKRGSKEISW